MAHEEPGLAYADYFAAAAGAVATTTTLVPEEEEEEEEDLHLYGAVHQPAGADMFEASRGGHMPSPAMMGAGPAASAAHGKQAALGLADGDVASPVVIGHLGGAGDHHHHRQLGRLIHQAPLSLSLHGAADAGPLALHHHHQPPVAWPQQQQQQQQMLGAWHLRGSRFLRPTQQLLQEFCALPVDAAITAANSKLPVITKPASDDGGSSSSAPAPAPSPQIQAMNATELQRLKTKLYAMLQEVERRYRRYREQMRAVSGSFEAVAGEQAAAAYTRLASRTISRHFRSLRDGVAAQMLAVRRALGEKDADGGGVPAAKGETTPRLRVIDQCLRQHRAYQAGVLETQPWRPQRGLPERAVSILRAWLFEHFLHPYPSDVDKHILARQTGLSRSQVSNWFINARVRLWKPMVEEMYSEEMKDPQQQEGACSNSNNSSVMNTGGYYSSEQQLGHGGGGVDGGGGEQKPTRAQLVVHEAGSLASVVSIGSSSRDHQQQQQQMSSINFGMMDHLVDFDAYNDGGPGPAAAGGGFGNYGGSGGVSLTLGLQQQQQQHADDLHGGVNIAFAAAPSAAHEFLFMAGGGEQQQQVVAGGGAAVHPSSHGGHGHHGQFSTGGMQGDGVPSSHYHRGLGGAATGFQLLHDLAG